MTDAPWVWFIGGPNGAGKTTLALNTLGNHLPQHFLNADSLARGLAPQAPESASVEAGRLLLGRFDNLITERTEFVVETTLSGRSYLRRINQLRCSGWRVGLIVVWLADADIAVQRVAERFRMGGHFVPEDDVRRRYDRMARNVRSYVDACDRAIIFDNSFASPFLVADGWNGRLVVRDFASTIPGSLLYG